MPKHHHAQTTSLSNVSHLLPTKSPHETRLVLAKYSRCCISRETIDATDLKGWPGWDEAVGFTGDRVQRW